MTFETASKLLNKKSTVISKIRIDLFYQS